jgi:hypothetical protein
MPVNLVVMSSQSAASTTNAILMLFSSLTENPKYDQETKWIFGFSLKN